MLINGEFVAVLHPLQQARYFPRFPLGDQVEDEKTGRPNPRMKWYDNPFIASIGKKI